MPVGPSGVQPSALGGSQPDDALAGLVGDVPVRIAVEGDPAAARAGSFEVDHVHEREVVNAVLVDHRGVDAEEPAVGEGDVAPGVIGWKVAEEDEVRCSRDRVVDAPDAGAAGAFDGEDIARGGARDRRTRRNDGHADDRCRLARECLDGLVGHAEERVAVTGQEDRLGLRGLNGEEGDARGERGGTYGEHAMSHRTYPRNNRLGTEEHGLPAYRKADARFKRTRVERTARERYRSAPRPIDLGFVRNKARAGGSPVSLWGGRALIGWSARM